MRYSVIMTCLLILFVVLFLILLVYSGMLQKILVRIGLAEEKSKKNWHLIAWENCLSKLNYKAEIVFFGDSLTRGSDFGKFFDRKIINLGVAGDTLQGMRNRISLVKTVNPEKVFILGGINNLNDDNCDCCVEEFEKLLTSMIDELPSAKIYVQSLFPVSFGMEKRRKWKCHNATIKLFNERIKEISERYGVCFINLYDEFLLNGEINPKLTLDGLHINEKAYKVWAKKLEEYIY